MIPAHIDAVLRKHRSHGLILDSNLLVFLIVGSTDPNLILEARPTRNKNFSLPDFELLKEIVGRVGKLVTTPHILAETSNLLDQIKGRFRDDVFAQFDALIRRTPESAVPALEVLSFDCFSDLGLTDCAVIHLAQARHLIITVDAPLAVELIRRKYAVLNYNHFRPSLHGAI